MRVLMVVLLLAACSSPSLRYAKVAPVRVVVEGSVYDVYALDREVQAIRVNMEMLPNKARSFGRAIAAIEQATGCKVVDNAATGDQALVNAIIRCN